MCPLTGHYTDNKVTWRGRLWCNGCCGEREGLYCSAQWWTCIDIDKELKHWEILRGLNEGTHTHTHSWHAVSMNAPCTQAPLQSSMIVPDMVPSLMVTDAHLLGSSHLFIYPFICVKFIYWWASGMWRQISICLCGKAGTESYDSVQHLHVTEQKTGGGQSSAFFYLDSSSWNSNFSLVMETWYGPFSYLALIPMV